MRLYEVIYQVLEDVQSALIGMLKPEFEEVVTGEAEVREVFSVPRIGKVAGCYVRNGTITASVGSPMIWRSTPRRIARR